jgi:hypothetical protein
MNPSASGINDSGQIVGYYPPMYVHGFLDTGGNFTTIDIPGATGTSAQGINDSGEIVGVFYEPGEISGYLATPVATPEPASLITLATCLVTLSGRAWHRKRALPQIAPQRDLEHCGGLLLLLPRRVEAALAKHHRPHCSDAPLALIAHERHVEDGVGAWAWFW